LVTVPESLLSLSWYTQVFPTASGNRAVPTVTLPLPLELAPFELAPFEVVPADAEPTAGWPEAELDVDAVVALELFPQPARTSPEAATAASTAAAAGVRVMKPDLFMSCLGLGVRRKGGRRPARDG
jgi:hypothetical protein